MKINNGFTSFGVIFMISIFLSIGISVLAMSVNLHNTSVHKMEFIERDYMLKTSLIYPETFIRDYYKLAFYKTLESIQLKYKNHDEQQLNSELINIQKDYKRLLKDELYVINQIDIHTTISKLKLDDCTFRITDFSLDSNKNILIGLRSSFDNSDITNSHTGEYTLVLADFALDEVSQIMNRDFDYLWETHKNDFKKEKDYVSY